MSNCSARSQVLQGREPAGPLRRQAAAKRVALQVDGRSARQARQLSGQDTLSMHSALLASKDAAAGGRRAVSGLWVTGSAQAHQRAPQNCSAPRRPSSSTFATPACNAHPQPLSNTPDSSQAAHSAIVGAGDSAPLARRQAVVPAAQACRCGKRVPVSDRPPQRQQRRGCMGQGGGQRRSGTQELHKWLQPRWMLAAETSRNSTRILTVFGLAGKSHILRLNRQHGKHRSHHQQRYELRTSPHRRKLSAQRAGGARDARP